MPDYDDLMNVGSETGIETEEFYSSSISTKIKEDKCEKLEQKPTTKKCTLSLKKLQIINTDIENVFSILLYDLDRIFQCIYIAVLTCSPP